VGVSCLFLFLEAKRQHCSNRIVYEVGRLLK
jgi:hypothetical protein